MDEFYMERAIELAKRGQGMVSPNPMVGAIIVKEGKIIGEGYHMCYGEAHAEVNAFNNAIADKKAENLVGLAQGITSGITSTIGNVQQRIRDDKSILANALSHPNLPIEEFYHNGLISKRAYKAYRKAHPLKTNTNEED